MRLIKCTCYAWYSRGILPQRVLDVDVAVQADGAEVEDGGRRTHDVEGDPRVTELCTEHPVAQKVVDYGKGHDERRDEEVGDGEGGEEEVADAAQSPVRVDGDAHQDVAEYGDENEHRQEYS